MQPRQDRLQLVGMVQRPALAGQHQVRAGAAGFHRHFQLLQGVVVVAVAGLREVEVGGVEEEGHGVNRDSETRLEPLLFRVH